MHFKESNLKISAGEDAQRSTSFRHGASPPAEHLHALLPNATRPHLNTSKQIVMFRFYFICQVKLYLKGDKDFCSIASDNKYTLIGIINVPPNDAGSVTVPIIPKIVGEVNVEVMAIGTIPRIGAASAGTDAVRKRLLVVVSLLVCLFLDFKPECSYPIPWGDPRVLFRRREGQQLVHEVETNNLRPLHAVTHKALQRRPAPVLL